MKLHRLILASGTASLGVLSSGAFSNTPARPADQIYQTYCAVCHATGWNGAPINGIKDDWESRAAAGFDSMLRNVKQGLNTMPPMGTCMDCSDAELQAAIEEMMKF
ncbi:cytochrome c5 [Povalibacter uvarum]|uniref:Cytochrome c5 n=1 Tax=Povalibacter uvarum TaxID=732238 RepID=A0A841HL46_9GAMM|nr:c-type cytochrome [Povalibacter uvarum]MBB6092948.1 cytochrome c5 [Povalibacter uvarum]